MLSADYLPEVKPNHASMTNISCTAWDEQAWEEVAMAAEDVSSECSFHTQTHRLIEVSIPFLLRNEYLNFQEQVICQNPIRKLIAKLRAAQFPQGLCHRAMGRWDHLSVRKIPAPIKIKSALPPPPTQNTPPPQNEEFYGHGGFLQKERRNSRCP